MGKAEFILGLICLWFREKQIWLITSFPWSWKPKYTLKEGTEKRKTNVGLNSKTFSWVSWAGSRNSHSGRKQHHPSFNKLQNSLFCLDETKRREQLDFVPLGFLDCRHLSVCGGFVSSPLLPQDGEKSFHGWAETPWCQPDRLSWPACSNPFIMISWVQSQPPCTHHGSL